MGIFDLNTEAIVVKEPFMGSNLYYIDNFYKNPNEIADLFNKIPKCHEGDFMKEKNIFKLHKAFLMHKNCSNCAV